MVLGSCRGSTGPDHGRIDEPKVVTQAAPLLQGVEQGGKDLRPGAVAAPAPEAAVDGFPRALGLRDVSPGGAGAQAPEDAVEEAVMAFQGPATAAAVSRRGEERRDALPVAIRKFMATAHGGPTKGNLLLRRVESAVV